jgi:hypothetical protein
MKKPIATQSKTTLVLAATAFLAASAPAFAGAIGGRYSLRSPCELTIGFDGQETVYLPAGEITVTENVPVSDMVTPEHAAIIFQSGGSFVSLLTLGIGKVTPFAYGGESSSVGTYSEDGSVFSEQYFPATADGESATSHTIKLERSDSGLVLTHKSDAPGVQPVVCTFYLAR